MKFQVYRATRNILPNQICEYYSPMESNYKHGNGMYFAFKKSYSEQFVGRKDGYAVLGHFDLEVGTAINHDGKRYLVDPESDLGKLQVLYEAITTEADAIHKSFGYVNVQEIPEYNIADKDTQWKILEEAIKANEAKEAALKETPHWAKFHELKKLANEVFYKYEEYLNQVDAVICSDSTGEMSGEISLKRPMPITLIMFDLHCSESEAQKIHSAIKVGELNAQGIMNIPGEYADKVSLLLKNS